MALTPKLFKEATAQLKDATEVYPLQSGHEFVFLSLSGILFVGSTAEQRYVLHEHFKDLGLAGPTAGAAMGWTSTRRPTQNPFPPFLLSSC